MTVLFIGVLMGALDIAIVGPALSAIRSDLGVGDRSLPWIFSIYVLFNLIGTPLMAKLSDLYGRRSIGHGVLRELGPGMPWLITSYHPSRQNTQTGRLTAEMFDAVWQVARSRLVDV